MHQELNKPVSYSKNLTLLSISTFLFGFACILLGYLFLPFAAASYATLLRYEKKNRKIFSYAIPVAIYAINILFNGFFSLEGVIYVAVGVMIYLFNLKERSKNEAVFWITFTLSAFILFSFFAIGFTSNGSLSFSALRAYYAGIYDSLKRVFVSIISSISTADEEGTLFFLFTRENAENIFHSLVLALPSLVIVIAFILTGITFKLFDFFTTRVFPEANENFGIFIPTKFLAYSFISIAILSVLSSSSPDIFAISINNVNNVLTAVFAYFGLKIAYSIVKNTRGSLFAVLLIVVALVLFGTTAITLLSFIGVFFALSAKEYGKSA